MHQQIMGWTTYFTQGRVTCLTITYNTLHICSMPLALYFPSLKDSVSFEVAIVYSYSWKILSGT